jgi:hypothetical protein
MTVCSNVIRTFLLISLLQVAVVGQTKQIAPAPIPTQILAAKKVFIANAGGDDSPYPDPLFSGGADRSYNQFYAAIKAAGRYELVGSPAEADLLFEIQFWVPTAEPAANRGESIATVAFDPQFRLAIRDPKTNALLWAFTEHVQWAILQGNRDKNFDQAAARIVADVQGLTARSAVAADSVKP